LVLLLLFGLGSGPELRRIYEKSLARIFAERASELQNCSLAVKVHPGGTGEQEQALMDWLRANVPAQVHPIVHPLNLEFMLPRLQPDYVVAGICGALPIVRRLKIARPIVLAELADAYLQDYPALQTATRELLAGVEVW